MDSTHTSERVVIVGAGVAGLSAGIFTARAGLETTLVDGDESILARNAFLENFPGFPAGVDSRLLLEMVRDHAERSGCHVQDGTVTSIDVIDRKDGDDVADGNGGDDVTDGDSEGNETDEDGEGDEPDGDRESERDDEDAEHDHRFTVTADGESLAADFVICTSWADTDYLSGLDVGLVSRGSKTYVDVDERGSTGLDGLYAAGRIAEKPHQTVVAAGHGAEVALTLIDDSDVAFYHDWVAPDGYFTGRGRDVPPGCEEIGEEERRKREQSSLEVMQEYFAEPHPDSPTQHPSVADQDD